MSKFEGKKLLVLGSNAGADDIVRYARSNGAYVFVADYYPPERSSAKRIADEAVMISTADLDCLGAFIEKREIDGVIAGVSEFNLLGAMTLCEQYDMPFYCTREQWKMVESKDCFRNLCVRYGVPCPQTYFSGADVASIEWDSIEYPAVVKPVDASSSSGVHICKSATELRAFLGDALSFSTSGCIIIEQFCKGLEFTAHFVVAGGRAALASVDNRYPVAVHEGVVTTVPVARVYPSTFESVVEERVVPHVCELCEGIGLVDAVVFVQGLYDAQADDIVVFEAGLRSAGEVPSRFIKRVNGNDYLGILVDHALLGQTDYDLSREDPTLGGRCCGVVSFVARGGVVGSIEGLEEAVEACPSLVECESRYPVGSTTPDGDTLRQLMIRFVMDCDSREQMAHDIEFLNASVSVKDTEGNDMVIKMDPARLFGVE